MDLDYGKQTHPPTPISNCHVKSPCPQSQILWICTLVDDKNRATINPPPLQTLKLKISSF